MHEVPGPVLRIDEFLPCGCRVRKEETSGKLRLWHCATHAAAFEMLEALRAGLAALEKVLDTVPAQSYDDTAVMEAAMKVRAAIRKGQGKTPPAPARK
jgi:hypothetical protein